MLAIMFYLLEQFIVIEYDGWLVGQWYPGLLYPVHDRKHMNTCGSGSWLISTFYFCLVTKFLEYGVIMVSAATLHLRALVPRPPASCM